MLHWVWLSLALPAGSAVGDQIYERFPDPEEFFRAGESALREIPGMREPLALRIRSTTLDMAKRAMERAGELGAAILCRNSPEFPQCLREIPRCPPVLYVRGSLAGWEERPAIAVVGSRHMSDYGRRAATLLGRELGGAGAAVVSGMAAGVDGAAHEACLEAGGVTVAVQGCGLDITYPPGHEGLKERIAERGAVVTEFAPGVEPRASLFPIRNRIISGLSLGVVVVEARARSGTSITANCALEQGRDVFAVPGDIFRSTARGTFQLLQQGAIPVSCAKDILEQYTRRFPLDARLLKSAAQPREEQTPDEPPRPEPRRAIPAGLSEGARAIFELLGRSPRPVDELSALAGLSAAQAAAALTELELCGLAEPCSGRRFQLAR